MTTFTATTYQNQYLPADGERVDAVIAVDARDADSRSPLPPAQSGSAIALILDVSGSMHPRDKWIALQQAAAAAISRIDDDVHFAVIAGADFAEVVYPRSGGMARANSVTRTEAICEVARMRPGGGTAIGRWLLEARNRLASHETSIRQAILVTDGRDEGETREELYAAVCASQGVFQCDCRGVGTDWAVAELRWIASCLMGSVDIVAEPSKMAADFEALMARAMGKRTADVRLRVWTPREAGVIVVKQVSPDIDDLTSRGTRIDERTVEYATGAWGTEMRDYHLAVSVPRQAVGSEMLAARVSLIVDGEVASQALVKATWTLDVVEATRLHPRVAHYTDQVELADAIAQGLSARERGDVATATQKFGEAAQRASRTGNTDTLRLLGGVVDVLDAATGTVRLRGRADVADVMTLDTRSTRTVRGTTTP
jgi:hypothetical protein